MSPRDPAPEQSGRPDPDALLRRLQAEEERGKRAKLKVFLGYAAGVGKTYKMLELAMELAAQGADLVVGYVETHKRYETSSMLLGLDILARRQVPYRGTVLEELDLEAALARRPQIVLVDELAHTNAPGGLHAKRWQDVMDLLHAGIEVHTTLNVQHVESLNDVVAQITGLRVRETVPDSVLERADEIELVDCPPDELLERLAEGKVYVPEQAARALENFFRRGNLLALRELAMRVATQRIDEDVRDYRAEHAIQPIWPSGERLLVCVGPAPASARLVRAASRIAGGLRAPWIAACVELTAGTPPDEADRDRLENHLRLADSLGGEVMRLSGPSVAPAILDYARRHNVTRIVIGKPTHPKLKDVLFGSLLEEIVRGSGDIDVLVLSGGGEARSDPPPVKRAPEPWGGLARALLWVGVATGGMVAARSWLSLAELVIFYLLVTMIVAVLEGRGPALLASLLSVAAYNFFFIPPYHTFAVYEVRHVFTFVLMFVVLQLLSWMVLRIRRQQQDVGDREARTAALYSLSRDLGSAVEREQVALIVAQHAGDVFDCNAAVLLAGPGGQLRAHAQVGSEVPLGPQEMSVARWVREHARSAGAGTDTLPGARVTCVPLTSGAECFGVLALTRSEVARPGGQEQHLLEAFQRQAALALEREHLVEEAKAAALRARTEQMRSSILSAVSHDLRTPLAVITGAATTLRDQRSAGIAESERAGLLDTICNETRRMERLVKNLLDMTRLESGALDLRREWVPLEEVIGSATARLESELAGRPMVVSVPESLPLVAVDPVLLEQVFVNLLDNAVKYTPAGSPIELLARSREDRVEVEVADRGPGLPEGAEASIFQKFYRGSHPGVRGAGLGLAIALGIAQAHGGTLLAVNRPGGGTCFTVTIPLGTEPPAVPVETEAEP